MMEDAIERRKEYLADKKKRVAKPLLWFGMVGIVMLFAGLTSAVIVRRGDGNWEHFEMPDAFLWSTIIIVLSSLTFIATNFFAKKDNQNGLKGSLALTFLLGTLFVVFQFEGYEQLYNQGVYFTGKGHNASGSYLYIVSWAHLAHLAGGLISLLVVLFNAFKGKYNSKNLLGLQLSSTYWHFLGGMWVYLYIFFRTVI
jgi:cytochrome c oxidase subunit 3